MSLDSKIAKVYKQASKELTEKVDSFFADFERLDKKKRTDVDAGKLTEAEYKKWRENKILRGKDFIALRDNMADAMLDANKIAASYINDELIPAYTKGFNRIGSSTAKEIPGYAFTLTNENAVKRLVTNKETILPYKFVDGKKDTRWNTKRVNSAVLQGIIQGEPANKIAKRLMKVTEMNKDSAIRNARTALTGATNHGRQDGMKQLQDDGVILQKEWLTAMDSHTRDAHAELHHVLVNIDEPFVNSIGEIMFPGDPNADPANVYNCRCSIATKIVGFRKKSDDDELDKELDDVWDTKGDYEPASSKAEFVRENKDAMKADGVKGNELWAQYEGTMMHEAQEHLHEVSNESAIETVRNGIPDSYRRGWFVNADSEYKPKIEDLILGDTEVLNAGWNIAYRDFMETVGKGSDTTLEQFMYTPMSMFRGTSGQKEIAADVWSSFSMDRKIAEGFAGKNGNIEEILIRPIDTWGAYQTTGEAEILVPKRMLEKLRGE